MKLNGWQRLGVIASVLWMIGAGVAERRGQIDGSYSYFSSMQSVVCPMASKEAEVTYPDYSKQAEDAGNAEYQRCIRSALETSEEKRSLTAREGSNIWIIAAFSTLPVLLGWLLAYASLKLGRWVKAGFTSGAGSNTTRMAIEPSEVSAPDNSINIQDARF